MIDLATLTWACMVCREERPDFLIGVSTKRVGLHGVFLQINVRYCRDKPFCAKRAEQIAGEIAMGITAGKSGRG